LIYYVTAAAGTVHPTPLGLLLNVQDDRAVGATMLELADGTVRWQLDGFVSQVPGSPRYGIVQQVDGRVVLGLQVIDLATGTERWTPAGSLRSGLGLEVLVDANCDAIIGRSIENGLERWRVVPLDGGTFCERNRPQLTVAADRIVVAEGTELIGIDAEGREAWRQDLGDRVLAGSNGPFVQLRRPDAVADQLYLDATTGDALTAEAQERLDSARRDRTVLARLGDETVVLLDTDAGVVRADRATAAVEGEPMAGAGAVGLGRTTVYRLDDAGDSLVGYDLASGATRWTVAVAASAVAASAVTGSADGGSVASTPRVFSADRHVVVGTATGDLVAFG
jgi:outer membrane protein assembly factor BamB